MKNEKNELKELKHETDPFYRKVFYVVFFVCLVYIFYIFLKG
ncbi:hypothetical protein THER_0681 [Thermodesulfovibrio sp. N1]|nr:hypothetical protein [Thermodesulfovibrio sp. N1]ODA44634.1 hypothetical protein THER_0681 [Thermodesulfovibrio sp. N1]